MNPTSPTEIRRLFLALILALNVCTAAMLLLSGQAADLIYGRDLQARFEALQRERLRGWQDLDWEAAVAAVSIVPEDKLPPEWRSAVVDLRRAASTRAAYEETRAKWQRCKSNFAGPWCASLLALTFFVMVAVERFLPAVSDPLEADWLDMAVMQRLALGLTWIFHGLMQPIIYPHHLILGLGFSLLGARFFKVATE